MIWAYAGMAALQMWQANQQAETIRSQGRLQERMDELNAKYTDIDAWEAEKFGFTEAARYQSVVDQTAADQKAGFIAQGVDSSYGTAKEVQAETKVTGMLNILDIKRRARNQAYGIKTEARNLRLQGAFARQQSDMNADATKTAGYLNAAQTGLSGYSRYGGKDTVPTEESSIGLGGGGRVGRAYSRDFE